MKKNELRQQQVLVHLVEEFVQTAKPISSKTICQKYLQNASPATIRIDLNKLEKLNFIYQSHTSAGRMPTIQGYRKYLELINISQYDKVNFLREMLVNYHKDIPLALHYVMQLLANETDQLSFVAEPEIAYGHLNKLDVFKIADEKLLFVVSLDSGIDKTVILKCGNKISSQQLKTIVRYVNEELMGLKIYDIQNKYLEDLAEKVTEENKLLKLFLTELQKAFTEISSYYIHFDGNISFLEQPEFNEKSAILTFLNFIQRQDHLVNLMQNVKTEKDYYLLMGEDLGQPELHGYTLIFAKYEIFGVPGFLGIVGSNRMDYKKNITIIRDVAKTITETTQKGMVSIIK
ncbi:MAG: heat-inducible transcription repressor HrcA [Candidatus Cloacimonetes bacterium]|jgi:heat-inducible transcriptional repressor|nr:heat-inducible transcription repressor HrcA [Candidatus Cloacimonadota bacterium]MBT6993339.1 heat-inducible transcription repressor HrcA [Candidatus Cloacimonadota bacterium]MBT7469976.1 heat-inducible transcription repressor HrcA [Candidatus Cloacimonadota bacterium]